MRGGERDRETRGKETDRRSKICLKITEIEFIYHLSGRHITIL